MVSLQDTHENSAVIYVILELGIWTPEHIFSYTTLSRNIRKNQQIPLYLLVFQKYLKVLYTQSPISLLLLSGWWRIYNVDIVYISIARSHQGLTISVLVTAGNRLISIFHQIRDSSQETPEPIQKAHHYSVPLQTLNAKVSTSQDIYLSTYSIRSWLVWLWKLETRDLQSKELRTRTACFFFQIFFSQLFLFLINY